jgi:ABC-2 type transport system permease protein
MIYTVKQSTKIAVQFLKRDFYSSSKFFGRYLFNVSFLRPLFLVFSLAYIQAHVIFPHQTTYMTTLLLIGNATMVMMTLACNIAMKLLFDCEKKRFINYQLRVMDPKFIILERLVFVTLYSFVLLLPFFPIVKLMLGESFNTVNASWPATFFMLFLGTLCCSAYLILALCILPSSKHISSLWMRVNIPLLWLGGLWAPLSIMKKTIPWLGFIAHFNPIMYITEGLRSAILGSQDFLSMEICACAMLGFTALSTMLAFYFFKNKTDHI